MYVGLESHAGVHIRAPYASHRKHFVQFDAVRRRNVALSTTRFYEINELLITHDVGVVAEMKLCSWQAPKNFTVILFRISLPKFWGQRFPRLFPDADDIRQLTTSGVQVAIVWRTSHDNKIRHYICYLHISPINNCFPHTVTL